MKKFAVIGAALAALVAAAPASAEDLTLAAQIQYVCSLKINGEGAGTINLKSTVHPLGSFNVTCNDPNGVKLKISSANGGQLKNGAYNVPTSFRTGTASTNGGSGLVIGNNSFGATGYEKSVSGFSVEHADSDGADYTFTLLTGTAPVLPGGVSLTDTLTFTVSGL